TGPVACLDDTPEFLEAAQHVTVALVDIGGKLVPAHVQIAQLAQHFQVQFRLPRGSRLDARGGLCGAARGCQFRDHVEEARGDHRLGQEACDTRLLAGAYRLRGDVGTEHDELRALAPARLHDPRLAQHVDTTDIGHVQVEDGNL